VNCLAAAMLVLARKLFLGENFQVADESLAIRKRYGLTGKISLSFLGQQVSALLV
jgi:hypothetical protein